MNTDGHRWFLRVMTAVIVSFAAMTASAGTPVPGGKWSWVWTDAKGTGQPMRVYTYRPRACDSTCPMLIALHGATRKASDMRDYWELLADRYKFLVVTPEFTEEKYPGDAYAIGGIGTDQNKEKWVIATVEHLFDEMRDGQAGYVLFGYSAGAQVAHRLALLRPDNRAPPSSWPMRAGTRRRNFARTRVRADSRSPSWARPPRSRMCARHWPSASS